MECTRLYSGMCTSLMLRYGEPSLSESGAVLKGHCSMSMTIRCTFWSARLRKCGWHHRAAREQHDTRSPGGRAAFGGGEGARPAPSGGAEFLEAPKAPKKNFGLNQKWR